MNHLRQLSLRASVALFVSGSHFDFLAAHRAQWDRLLVRVLPDPTQEGTRLTITGYTFTDHKSRPGRS